MSAPVPHTCPDIDRIIKSIKACLKIAKDGKSQFKGEDPHDYFDDIESELWSLEYDLNSIRQSNDALRKWGYDTEDEVKSLNNYIIELESEINKN